MKVREYLNLVKFLDARNRNELTTFVLNPVFNISPDLHPFALTGAWKFNAQNDIEFPEQYSYLLDFYVISDKYHGVFTFSENGKAALDTIVLEITPQTTLYEPKIPHEILGDIVKNAISEHEEAVEKRKGGKWFIWE